MTLIITAILTGIIGFFIGSMKFYREEKHKAYRELLPPIVKAAYNPEPIDEEEFNKALCKLWLYGRKGVAEKMDTVVSRIIDPKRGSRTEPLQEAIVLMRRDLLLPWPFQRLNPKDIRHLYSQIMKKPSK